VESTRAVSLVLNRFITNIFGLEAVLTVFSASSPYLWSPPSM
jgi:hypothetical protein